MLFEQGLCMDGSVHKCLKNPQKRCMGRFLHRCWERKADVTCAEREELLQHPGWDLLAQVELSAGSGRKAVAAKGATR